MQDTEDAIGATAMTSFERELHLVREAVVMVASGHAPRVTVAGVLFQEPLLDRARRLALEAGVRLVVIPRVDLIGSDVAIERIRG
jgi:hypothetical protein